MSGRSKVHPIVIICRQSLVYLLQRNSYPSVKLHSIILSRTDPIPFHAAFDCHSLQLSDTDAGVPITCSLAPTIFITLLPSLSILFILAILVQTITLDSLL